MNTQSTLLAASVALLAGTTAVYASHVSRSRAEREHASEARTRDLDIAFYSARVQRDPTGADDLARLAALYLQRARETGKYDDVLRADSAARHSLRNRLAHNARAEQVLASSLLSQHRFAEALHVAKRLAAADPDRPSYRAQLGEIQLELGLYEDARATFRSLAGHERDLSVAPRLARWAEVEGRTGEARKLLDGALVEAMGRQDLPREQVAWFWLRMGELMQQTGRPRDAQSAFRRGLEAHPDDYRLLAAMSHLAAVRRRWKEAVNYGERAIAATLEPATLGTLSDAYAALGDTAKASEYARVMEMAVLKQPGAYDRAWSLFLLDHDRHDAEVLADIEEELRSRRDIYGYDLLAWARYKQGRYAEARAAMHRALAQGTRDAMLFYHAGMIDRALGNRALARRELERALVINPYFHATQADVARAALHALRAGDGRAE